MIADAGLPCTGPAVLNDKTMMAFVDALLAISVDGLVN